MTIHRKRGLRLTAVYGSFILLVASLIFPPLAIIAAIFAGVAIGTRGARAVKARQQGKVDRTRPTDYRDYNQTRGY